MAASETFASYITALSPKERALLHSLISARQSDLFAARSEDARLRIVEEFIEEAHVRVHAERR